MKKPLLILAMLSFALTVSGRALSQTASRVEDLSRPAGNAPPMLGIHWARGFDPNFLQRRAHAAHGTTSSPDIHGTAVRS